MGPYATRHQVSSFVSSIFNFYSTFLPIIKFERVNNQCLFLHSIKWDLCKKYQSFAQLLHLIQARNLFRSQTSVKVCPLFLLAVITNHRQCRLPCGQIRLQVHRENYIINLDNFFSFFSQKLIRFYF